MGIWSGLHSLPEEGGRTQGKGEGGQGGNSFPGPHRPSSYVHTGSQGAPHRYVDRVTEFLQQKLKQSQLLALKKELMVEKQQEALQEQAALEPKLDLLLEKTRELQKLVRSARGLPGRTPTSQTVALGLPVRSLPTPFFFSQIEADISKRYNGRPVNLMGTSL